MRRVKAAIAAGALCFCVPPVWALPASPAAPETEFAAASPPPAEAVMPAEPAPKQEATAPSAAQAGLPAETSDLQASYALAVQEARSYLPRLMTSLAQADSETRKSFSVLVRPADGAETVWLGNLRLENGALEGKPANGGEAADLVRIGQDAVLDWAIAAQEGRYGDFTTRATMPSMAPKERAALARALTKDPVPPAWRAPAY